MTANSLASVSLVPPLVSVCVERLAEMHQVLNGATRYVLNVLSEAHTVNIDVNGNVILYWIADLTGSSQSLMLSCRYPLSRHDFHIFGKRALIA